MKKHAGPDVQKLQLDLSRPASPWNMRAIELLAAQVQTAASTQRLNNPSEYPPIMDDTAIELVADKWRRIFNLAKKNKDSDIGDI